MPFARPTLDDLRALAKADVAAALEGSDPLLRFSNLGIMADVLAEGAHGAYAYLDWISKQATPFKADEEAFEGWAALKDVIRKPATQAVISCTFPAADGLTMPADTPVSRRDGVEYLTVAEVTADGPTIVVQARAVNAGSAGTLADGSPIVIGQAIAGIGSTGVANLVTAGVDVEEFEAFRTRVLGVYAAPPQGGAKADYEQWALEVPGVTRAWCVPLGNGPGTVVTYVMMDVANVDDDGFPQGDNGVATLETRDTPATEDLLTVADYIYPLRPVTALSYLKAPLPNTVTFTINLAGATEALKVAVEAAIAAVLLAYGAPGGTVNNSTIESAINAIAGSSGFVITAEACTHGAVSPGSAGNITSDAGYIPVLGVVTWTP